MVAAHSIGRGLNQQPLTGDGVICDYVNSIQSDNDDAWRRRFVVVQNGLLKVYHDQQEFTTGKNAQGASCKPVAQYALCSCDVELQFIGSFACCVVTHCTDAQEKPFCFRTESTQAEQWMQCIDDVRCSLVVSASEQKWQAVLSLLEQGWWAGQSSRENGRTALHFAAGYGSVQATRKLLESGSDVDSLDKSGMSPLHCAARKGFVETVRVLLCYGANPFLSVTKGVSKGKMAIDFGCERGNRQVVEALLEHIADLSWVPISEIMQFVQAALKVTRSIAPPGPPRRESRSPSLTSLGSFTPRANLLQQADQSFANDAPVESIITDPTRKNELEIGGGQVQLPDLKMLMNEAQMPIYIKDEEGRYVFVNDEMLRLLGRSLHNVLGHTAQQLDGMETGEEYKQGTGDAAATNKGGSEIDPDASSFVMEEIIDASGVTHRVTSRKATFVSTCQSPTQQSNTDESSAGMPKPWPGPRRVEVAVLKMELECSRCGVQFSFWLSGLTRRHHCRSCWRAFCGKCSAHRAVIPDHGSEEQRVCYTCFVSLSSEGKKSVFEGSREERLSTMYSAGAANVSLHDFEMLGILGRGGFGRVLRVKHKSSSKEYAMKVMEKRRMQKSQQIRHVLQEKAIMAETNHPFVVQLWYAFQSPSKVYMVIDLAEAGDLFSFMQRQARFRITEQQARFVAAEVTLALQYLHSKDIVHRDLKPENVLIDSEGHMKLADFGLSAPHAQMMESCQSVVGTPDYMAPEIISKSGHGKAVDWWSLGILLYEMLVGEPPFSGTNAKATYEHIRSTRPPYIPSFVSKEARDIINRFLIRDSTARLGSGVQGTAAIRMHPFFRSIDWELLEKRLAPSPFHISKDASEPDWFTADIKKKQARDVVKSVFDARARPQQQDEKFKDFDFMAKA